MKTSQLSSLCFSSKLILRRGAYFDRGWHVASFPAQFKTLPSSNPSRGSRRRANKEK